MIDPVSIGLALSGIQKAVSLVKQASQTVEDVASLGPVLGNLFSAEGKAIKAAEDAKKSGNASNMQIAIQIEMALDEVKQMKSQYQLLFMQAGRVDLWNQIIARAGQMDQADKMAVQAAKDRAAAKKKDDDEALTILAIIMAVLALLGFFGFVYFQIQDLKPQPVHHGHRPN